MFKLKLFSIVKIVLGFWGLFMLVILAFNALASFNTSSIIEASRFHKLGWGCGSWCQRNV